MSRCLGGLGEGAPSDLGGLASLGGLSSYPGAPDIPCIRAPPVKNSLRPILSQLDSGPIVMKFDYPPALTTSATC